MNLYWVTTPEHDEDCFVAASDEATAKQLFVDELGLHITESSAERISGVILQEGVTRYVLIDELKSIGFSIINTSNPVVLRYKSRIFRYDMGMQLALLASADGSNCVYFLRACGSDQYKIGITCNIRSRVRNIQTGNPCVIKLISLLICPSPNLIEVLLHKEFRMCRIHGEWFELSNQQALAVCERLKSFADGKSKLYRHIGIGDALGL